MNIYVNHKPSYIYDMDVFIGVMKTYSIKICMGSEGGYFKIILKYTGYIK